MQQGKERKGPADVSEDLPEGKEENLTTQRKRGPDDTALAEGERRPSFVRSSDVYPGTRSVLSMLGLGDLAGMRLGLPALLGLEFPERRTYNIGSLPQALGLEMCPVSPPSPPGVPTLRAPQPKVDLCWSPGDLTEKEELVGRLAQAIEGGDEKGAAQAAATLARHHVALSVQLQEACFPPGPIRLQVTVEDAASSAHVSLHVHPHCTIATLQEQVFSEFGFPPAVQRWVIGRRLCVPERSLASYGVQRDGDPAFLYLLSAPREAPGRSPQCPQKMDGELSRLFPQSLGQPRAPLPATSSLPSPLQPGWSCPSCTFINAPSRPGCEMCSTQKPCTWDPLPAVSTPLAKVTRREDGPVPPGSRSLDPLLKLSGDLC